MLLAMMVMVQDWGMGGSAGRTDGRDASSIYWVSLDATVIYLFPALTCNTPPRHRVGSATQPG